MEILSKQALKNMSSLALAHMGDAVFEILVRTELCKSGASINGNLHKLTVEQVCAPAQAKFADRILPHLTEEEEAVYRRGRNAHVNMIPKNATRAQYGKATGLEALFGMLYLSGQNERIAELFGLGRAKEENNAV